MNPVIIKAIHMPDYSLELFKTPSDLYVVTHTNNLGQIENSSPMKDFNLASYMFELTLSEIVGQ